VRQGRQPRAPPLERRKALYTLRCNGNRKQNTTSSTYFPSVLLVRHNVMPPRCRARTRHRCSVDREQATAGEQTCDESIDKAPPCLQTRHRHGDAAGGVLEAMHLIKDSHVNGWMTRSRAFQHQVCVCARHPS